MLLRSSRPSLACLAQPIVFIACLAALAGCGGSSGNGDEDAGPRPGTDAGTSPPSDSGTGPGHDAGPVVTSDAGPASPCEDFTPPALTTEEIAPGHTFSRPIYVTYAPGVPDTLFVVESRGRIQRVSGGTVSLFLDITSVIGPAPVSGDERGLLSVAFHPSYATNGRFFVGYTPMRGTPVNVVAEYHRSTSDPNVADPTEVARLVEQPDPETNHNGGLVKFGPDGFLYAGMGDGGGAGDEHGSNGNGLNKDTLLAKMLRLDVDNAAGGYAAAGNPFASGGGRPQIWAYGLRNPWRFSFDRRTGDLYIGDVGQNSQEEVDFQPASSTGGENYGWRAFEGTQVYDADSTSLAATRVEPIITYNHGSRAGVIRSGCSISGGYVYRGSAIPELAGVYMFADYCSADFAALRYCDGHVVGAKRIDALASTGGSVVSLGEDERGELYIVYLEGSVVRIVRG